VYRFIIDMRGRGFRFSGSEGMPVAARVGATFGSGMAAAFLADPQIPAGIPGGAFQGRGASKVKAASTEDDAGSWIMDG
jgi:hypothetical protein